MRMLGIYNSTNKRFRRDGDEFKREARAWQMENKPVAAGNTIRLQDVQDGKVRAEIRKMTDGLDVLAIFDHGTPRGLPRMRESYKNVKGLAQTIAGVTSKITIILYACSCGKGWWWNKFRWLRARKNKRDLEVQADEYNPRDGYALALCCELKKRGVDATIYGHLTWGHCCRLPHVAGVNNFAGAIHRERLVSPKDPYWKDWVARMKTNYRFTFWR